MKIYSILSLISLLIVINYITFTFTDTSFRRNGAVLNINWVTSLPWDVSNTLRAPLGGPLSLILSSCLSVIMFFGLAVSPVYYLLGTPYRKYHWHDSIIDRFTIADRHFPKNSTLLKILKSLDLSFLKFSNETDSNYSKTNSSGSISIDAEGNRRNDSSADSGPVVEKPYPDFLESLFWFIGEEDVNCQKLMVCHAHGFFNYVPDGYFKYYRIFSSKMVSIPKDFQYAIQVGLKDQDDCMTKFSNCSHDIVTISKNTISNILPTDLTPLYSLIGTVKTWLNSNY